MHDPRTPCEGSWGPCAMSMSPLHASSGGPFLDPLRRQLNGPDLRRWPDPRAFSAIMRRWIASFSSIPSTSYRTSDFLDAARALDLKRDRRVRDPPGPSRRGPGYFRCRSTILRLPPRPSWRSTSARRSTGSSPSTTRARSCRTRLQSGSGCATTSPTPLPPRATSCGRGRCSVAARSSQPTFAVVSPTADADEVGRLAALVGSALCRQADEPLGQPRGDPGRLLPPRRPRRSSASGGSPRGRGRPRSTAVDRGVRAGTRGRGRGRSHRRES